MFLIQLIASAKQARYTEANALRWLRFASDPPRDFNQQFEDGVRVRWGMLLDITKSVETNTKYSLMPIDMKKECYVFYGKDKNSLLNGLKLYGGEWVVKNAFGNVNLAAGYGEVSGHGVKASFKEKFKSAVGNINSGKTFQDKRNEERIEKLLKDGLAYLVVTTGSRLPNLHDDLMERAESGVGKMVINRSINAESSLSTIATLMRNMVGL